MACFVLLLYVLLPPIFIPPLLAYDYICYAHYRRAGFHLCLFIAYA